MATGIGLLVNGGSSRGNLLSGEADPNNAYVEYHNSEVGALVPDEGRWKKYRDRIPSVTIRQATDHMAPATQHTIIMGAARLEKPQLRLLPQAANTDIHLLRRTGHDSATRIKQAGILSDVLAGDELIAFSAEREAELLADYKAKVWTNLEPQWGLVTGTAVANSSIVVTWGTTVRTVRRTLRVYPAWLPAAQARSGTSGSTSSSRRARCTATSTTICGV